jgi:hypothetical protein
MRAPDRLKRCGRPAEARCQLRLGTGAALATSHLGHSMLCLIIHTCGHERTHTLSGDRFLRDHHRHELSLSPCRDCAAEWARLTRVQRSTRRRQAAPSAA